MREGQEEAREKEEETESPTSIVRLTGRDKELMGHVATARYLTLQQLKKIVFVRSLNGKEGRGASGKDGPSDIVCRRRLMRLCEVRPRPGYKFHPRGRRKTRPVIDLLRFVSGLAADLVRRRVELVAENALLRQQLIVAERKVAGRIMWTPWQRFTIVFAARITPAWREATLLIEPATILRWHRSGYLDGILR